MTGLLLDIIFDRQCELRTAALVIHMLVVLLLVFTQYRSKMRTLAV